MRPGDTRREWRSRWGWAGLGELCHMRLGVIPLERYTSSHSLLAAGCSNSRLLLSFWEKEQSGSPAPQHFLHLGHGDAGAGSWKGGPACTEVAWT